MRVMGIDPGIERTGFAVLEMEKGAPGAVRVLDCGRIFTDKRHPFSHRLNLFATDLKNLIRQWKPDAASIEQIFFSKNVKTAMRVSHARGVILETLEENGVPVQEFNPAHIKLSVTGDAKADKLQMKKMIQCLLGIALKSDDATDAIACALCCLHMNPYEKSASTA